MLCFRKIPAAKKFMVKTGGDRNFPSKTFFLRRPKHLAEEPLCVVFQKISGRENVYG